MSNDVLTGASEGTAPLKFSPETVVGNLRDQLAPVVHNDPWVAIDVQPVFAGTPLHFKGPFELRMEIVRHAAACHQTGAVQHAYGDESKGEDWGCTKDCPKCGLASPSFVVFVPKADKKARNGVGLAGYTVFLHGVSLVAFQRVIIPVTQDRTGRYVEQVLAETKTGDWLLVRESSLSAWNVDPPAEVKETAEATAGDNETAVLPSSEVHLVTDDEEAESLRSQAPQRPPTEPLASTKAPRPRGKGARKTRKGPLRFVSKNPTQIGMAAVSVPLPPPKRASSSQQLEAVQPESRPS